jgi:hypothetical protein
MVGRGRWDDRIRRAAEIYWLAQCSDDEAVRFLLSCLALEILVAHDRTPILKTLVPTRPEAAVAADLTDLQSASEGPIWRPTGP